MKQLTVKAGVDGKEYEEWLCETVSRHALRDLLHISRDTLLAVFLRTMCVRHVDFKGD